MADRYTVPQWTNDAAPAINAQNLTAMSTAIRDSQIITGSVAPTDETAGVVGQLYFAEESGCYYYLSSIMQNGGVGGAYPTQYLWEPVVDEGFTQDSLRPASSGAVYNLQQRVFDMQTIVQYGFTSMSEGTWKFVEYFPYPVTPVGSGRIHAVGDINVSGVAITTQSGSIYRTQRQFTELPLGHGTLYTVGRVLSAQATCVGTTDVTTSTSTAQNVPWAALYATSSTSGTNWLQFVLYSSQSVTASAFTGSVRVHFDVWALAYDYGLTSSTTLGG